jgi:ABC-type oligopeptide transport system substrate-binding subunit
MSGSLQQGPYPLSGSVSEAEALMQGRTGIAVMAIPSRCDRCTHAAQVVRANLLAIGIEVRVREVDDLRAALRSGAEFDLVDALTEILYPDAGSFLAQMLEDVPRGWTSASVQRRIGDVAGLGGDARRAAASDVAEWLVSDELAVVAYGTPQTSQFVGPGIGCRVFTSFGYGLDLASLCLNTSAS